MPAVDEELARAFLAGFRGTQTGADTAALGRALEEALGRACARWPGVSIDGAALARHLGARAAPGDDPVAALAALETDELALALACLGGDVRAIAELERGYLGALAAVVAQVDREPAFVDEVVQSVRAQVLVGDGDGGKIASYAGSGPLAGWLRVVALRAAMALRKSAEREQPVEDEVLEAVQGHLAAPERDLLKGRYAADLRAAFAEALAGLEPKERNLLRYYYVEQLGVEELGKLYGVHFSTVSRWLGAARTGIVTRTRTALAARLGPAAPAAESLLDLAQSIELSLGGLLGGTRL